MPESTHVPAIEELTESIIAELRRLDPGIRHVFLQPSTTGRD